MNLSKLILRIKEILWFKSWVEIGDLVADKIYFQDGVNVYYRYGCFYTVEYVNDSFAFALKEEDNTYLIIYKKCRDDYHIVPKEQYIKYTNHLF